MKRLGLKSGRLLLWALAVLAGSCRAMDESVSSSQSASTRAFSASPAAAIAASQQQQQHQHQQHQQHQQQQQQQQQHYGSSFDLSDRQLDKRAYTYRSEFKRLPLYQFGLGKRLVQSMADKRGQPFSFGLGKRMGKQYAFGLGKRSSSSSGGARVSGNRHDEPLRLSSPALESRLADVYAQRFLENYLETKRASSGGFNFGLGKRDSGGLGRDYELQDRLPAKHSRDNLRYQFGLGKRDGSADRSQEEFDEEEEEEEEEEKDGDDDGSGPFAYSQPQLSLI